MAAFPGAVGVAVSIKRLELWVYLGQFPKPAVHLMRVPHEVERDMLLSCCRS